LVFVQTVSNDEII